MKKTFPVRRYHRKPYHNYIWKSRFPRMMIGAALRTAKLQFYNVLTKAESRISEQNRSLGVVTTFLSDNPAILTLADDRYFKSLFKRYQFPTLTNLGTQCVHDEQPQLQRSHQQGNPQPHRRRALCRRCGPLALCASDDAALGARAAVSSLRRRILISKNSIKIGMRCQPGFS